LQYSCVHNSGLVACVTNHYIDQHASTIDCTHSSRVLGDGRETPVKSRALLSIKIIISCILLVTYMISTSLVHLGFVVNEMPSAKFLHRELQVFPASIIPPLHRTHSFTSHQTCVFLPTESVIKQHTFKAYLYEYNRTYSFLCFLPHSAFSNRIPLILMCVIPVVCVTNKRG